MFASLGRGVSRHPFITIGVWVVITLLAVLATFTGFGGKGLFASLQSDNPVVPGSESEKVYELTVEGQGEQILLVVKMDEPSEKATQSVLDEVKNIKGIEGVETVVAPQEFEAAVAEIDAALQQAEADQAQAEEEAQAQIEQAQAEIEQLAQVDPQAAAAAQAELEASVAQQQADAEAALEEAQAELATAEENRELAAQQVDNFTSAEGDGFVLVTGLDPDASDEVSSMAHDRVVAAYAELNKTIEAEGGSSYVQSTTLITDELTEQVQSDLVKGEAIGLPVALILMVVVFGGLLAAGLPLVGALVSIGVGMGGIWALTHVMSIDAFLINIVSIIGLGLSIDYGLLVVSRFREEAQQRLEAAGYAKDGSDLPTTLQGQQRDEIDELVTESVSTTIQTAGRTVFFSALTIAVSIASLLVMDTVLLKVIGIGGMMVVLLAVLTAITLIPAIIEIIGHRMIRPSVISRIPLFKSLVRTFGDAARDEGVFSKIARFVHARPWTILLGVVAILGIMAFPIKDMQLRSSIEDMLPQGSGVETAYNTINEDYPALRTSEITVASETPIAEIDPDVSEIQSIVPDADVAAAPSTDDAAISVISVDMNADDPVGDDVVQAVKDLRAADLGSETYVGGAAAMQHDFSNSLLEGLPLALLIVVVAVFALLFLMTGSVVVPIRAIIINGLSLLASMGLTVFLFENGLLGLEKVAGLESFVVAAALAFGFGLAMDYEVFLLSRIKEYWDQGLSNDEAVERGLQRSGRIITSAAAIIIAVFIGFVFGEMGAIKQAGVSLAIIVFVDATLVRMLLVPATMTLLGKWNWWAPNFLQKFYQKHKIEH